MAELPEKKYQDGSTGLYVVTCEYCSESFLGHERDTTCPVCEKAHEVEV